MMIGRAAIGYPWIFNEIKHFFETEKNYQNLRFHDRLLAVKQHAEWSAEWKGERLGLIEMRQHYSNYFRGISHFKEFKTKFLQVLSLEEFYQLLEETEVFYKNKIEIYINLKTSMPSRYFEKSFEGLFIITMKIISYNVKRNSCAFTKDFIGWLQVANPDIICIQESKAGNDQIDIESLEKVGYKSYWHSAVRKRLFWSGNCEQNRTKTRRIRLRNRTL